MTIVKKLLVTISLAFSVLCYSGYLGAAPVEPTQGSHTKEMITFNINTADADTIADLMNGIGPKKAQAIIEYRAANGPFENLEALLAVKGIGNATISKNKGLVVFN
jgi:competence protein ComEA